MDVTQQIDRQMIVSGGGSSRPEYYSVNRSLDRSKGSNSLINAESQLITALPHASNYKDSVGLFGAENIFIKVELDVQNVQAKEDTIITINDYTECIITEDKNSNMYWDEAERDYALDLFTVNEYEPAVFINELTILPRSLVKVDLNNLKTGNKYIDAWFDVRLYQKNREEHPYDIMYVPYNSYFYVGFHARNTKRLPYNVSMTVDGLYSEYALSAAEKRYLVS